MAVVLGVTSCNDDDAVKLTEEQQALLGRAVNFNATLADAFNTRTTYRSDGTFNEGDLMVIYRQYSNDNGKTFDEENEGYRVYNYQPKTISGTNFSINTEWKVKVGKTGYEKARGTFTQTAADSLTWDNSQTVRFRAWALSNLSGCLNNGSWDRFYPDFTKSDWVTATGPTVNVPLQLKHLACRLAIVPKSGNEITKVEICTEAADYMYKDNADSKEDDEKDICTEEEATSRAKAVKEAYQRLCTPGGVDFSTGLKALSVAYTKNGSVSNIETEDAQKQMIGFGEKTADELATEAVHPEFHYNNGNQYFIAIPHDISNDENKQGERLSLPYYTRFRVYIRDVNNGDKNTPGYEGGYHILALNDITDADGNCMFTEKGGGLQFIAGYSYQFTVGYKYNALSVKMNNRLSWTEQDVTAANLEDKKATEPTSTKYKWWKDAIDTSIKKVLDHEEDGFNPVFNISSAAEFIEFIQLVNGTAASGYANNYKNKGYTLEKEEVKNEDGTSTSPKTWKWYKVMGETRTQITQEEAEENGVVFYNEYYPQEGDNAAYYEMKVLDGSYAFYSTLVNRKFTVNITQDIDLQDLPLTTIGTAAAPFLGILNGNNHILSNVYMQSGYLFDCAGKALENMGSTGNGAVISNLVIDSEHPICIVKEGTQVKILGIRLLAPSFKSAFAEKLSGVSYLVGCSNEGDATNGLVGEADNLFMYGCMQTATGITGGALLGKYSTDNKFFAPQKGTVEWGNFMCNFYDIDHSPNATAVGSITDAYQRQQYIRGSKTYMLCAWNDNLVTDRETLAELKNQAAFAGFYGLAPWKAMNYAIYQYNQSDMGKLYPCNAQYEKGGTSGYSHRYPVLKSGTPKIETDWNVLELLN